MLSKYEGLIQFSFFGGIKELVQVFTLVGGDTNQGGE
jgi:hypothetical protein